MTHAGTEAVHAPLGACVVETLERRVLLSAEPLIVNSLLDVVDPGDGVLTLREAIIEANLNGADTIQFDSSLAGGAILLSGEQLPVITGELTIIGLGADNLAIDAQEQSRIFHIGADAVVQLSGLTLTGGWATGDTPPDRHGGAIFNSGTLTIADTVITTNTAASNGGALFNSGGTLTVMRSTISDNTAGSGGGGIHNPASGTLAVINSTISDNTAGQGGGILNLSPALSITNSTIVLNRAQFGGGGIHTGGDPALVSPTLHNTIVAGNVRGQDLPNDLLGPNFQGAHNLIGDAATSGGLIDGDSGNIVGIYGTGTRPLSEILDPNLADNGGPTLTHALVAGSPAIDAGDDALVPTGVTTDQRGEDRFVGVVDIGAYEFAAPAVPQTLVVNTVSDEPANGLLTLREAIHLSNLSPTADTIIFDLAPEDDTILLSGEQLPTITGDLTILGPGADQLTIDANVESRIFHIAADAVVEISGLTLLRGHASGSGQDGAGGAILNEGALTLIDTTIAGTTADGSGGGIFSSGSLTLIRSTITNSHAQQFGGAIFNNLGSLTLIQSIITNSHALQLGGAIFNNASLTLIDSAISDNSSNSSGGGIFTPTVGPADVEVNIIRSTLDNNSANGSGGAIAHGRGVLTLTNSTLSSNFASLQGGGIHNRATLIATNSTIVLNHAHQNGGGVVSAPFQDVPASTTLNNTIVAGNLRGTVGSEEPSDLAGFPVNPDSAHNLIGDPGSSGGLGHEINGNIIGEDFGDTLDISSIINTTLADNGGPTLTHALVAGSPAIDAGNDALVPSGVTTDQRGEDRFFNTVDIGAYEFHVPPAPLTLVVDSTDDDFVPGSLTLREAIHLANLSSTADTITFEPWLAGQVIHLTGGQLPAITGELTIIGPGAEDLTLLSQFHDGHKRFFEIGPDAVVQISGLTMAGAQGESIGGAILNHGTLSLSGVNIQNIVVSGDGGAILNSGTLMMSDTEIDGSYAGRGGAIFNTGTLTLSGSTLRYSWAQFDGGAIYNDGGTVTLTDTLIEESDANRGGAIFNTGTLTIDSSTLSHNWADTDGGAIYNAGALAVIDTWFVNNHASAGGAIYNSGTLSLLNSTLSENRAFDDGGGIYNSGTLSILNSTLSGNLADRHGGGIYNDGESLTVTNSTFVLNRANNGITFGENRGGQGGGIRVLGPTTLNNTLLDQNPGGDVVGAVEAGSANNLVRSGSPFASGGLSNGVNGNIVGVHPMIQTVVLALADNGGPTLTHALVPGSPAIDAGSDSHAQAAGLTTDQRGEVRIIGGAVDIGAVEAPLSMQPVTFADANLEAAIRDELQRPLGAIAPSHMHTLVELNASGRGIIHLDGIEYAVNLEVLDLSNNHISDITPLEGLTNLQVLDLSNQTEPESEPEMMTFSLMTMQTTSGGLSDIGALADLTELEELYLAGNQIADIAPVANLTKLRKLNVAKNQIEDISPVASLTTLEHLEIQDNHISDISPLVELIEQQKDQGFTPLQQVNLENNSIEVTPEVVAALKELNEDIVISASQTITFAVLEDLTYGDGPILLAATASSGLAVTYSVQGPAEIVDGSTLMITGAGTVTVTASQSGDETFAPAADASRTFVVHRKVLEVDIDIRPETLNIESNGVISLLISGSEMFNVYDHQNTILGSLEFVYRHETDEGDLFQLTTGQIAPASYEFTADGANLLVHFAVEDLREFLRGVYAHLLELEESTYSTLYLTGDYDDNHTFEGEDNIRLLLNGRALRDFLEQLSEYEWWHEEV